VGKKSPPGRSAQNDVFELGEDVREPVVNDLAAGGADDVADENNSHEFIRMASGATVDIFLVREAEERFFGLIPQARLAVDTGRPHLTNDVFAQRRVSRKRSASPCAARP
jgi:hypothetical protein